MANDLIDDISRHDSIGLLSVTKGHLDIARIPVVEGPDWIIPKSLILAITPYHERIWTYLWQGQEVFVYQLLPKEQQSDYLLVLESATDVHRVGLQIAGEVQFHSVRIADLKDADDEIYHQTLATLYPKMLENIQAPAESEKLGYKTKVTEHDFVYQPVILQDELCIIPNLDKLSHFLVDLDS
ncbi:MULTISPECIES: hypothetical protein [unclassified Moraxella]|uniref:hypothetical protein n=1 Tax=unclassified Moraxella TaxID=2685852 RepID=UPI003AF79DB1